MEQESLHMAIGRLDGKIDIMLASQSSLSDRIAEVATKQGEHGERLVALETRSGSIKWSVPVFIAAVAAFAAIFKGFFFVAH